MPKLGLGASITILIGFAVLLVFVWLSLSFWHGLGVLVIGLIILSIYGHIAPETESRRRWQAGENLTQKGDPDRPWFFVGWDDHLSHGAPYNRPFRHEGRALDLYDLGYNARLEWSRGFTR